ncbi:MAG: PH domain-containing protein [Saprospiraceae bacterium]|nr:PH domain-containing protein [Saprospiraceae bacterium]
MELFENRNIAVEGLVQVDKPRLIDLESSYLRVIIISRVISILFLIGIIITVFMVMDEELKGVVILLGIPVLLLYSVWSLLTAYKGFKYKGYALREKDISYQKGWLWRSYTTVAINRVQHVRVDQGFIERQFNLSRIKVFTAGGTGSDITIPGLRPEQADRIKEFIVQRTAHDEEE